MSVTIPEKRIGVKHRFEGMCGFLALSNRDRQVTKTNHLRSQS
jgi:hypothetical protein